MGLGAGVPCPPSRPCAGSPLCCWDTNVRTPLEDPSAGVGGGAPPTGPRAPPPPRAAGLLYAPLLRSARAGATGTPPPQCPPSPGQAWHRRRNRGVCGGWRWGQDLVAGARSGWGKSQVSDARLTKSWGIRIFPGVGWGKTAGKASCVATVCIRWPRCRDLGRKEGEGVYGKALHGAFTG